MISSSEEGVIFSLDKYVWGYPHTLSSIERSHCFHTKQTSRQDCFPWSLESVSHILRGIGRVVIGGNGLWCTVAPKIVPCTDLYLIASNSIKFKIFQEILWHLCNRFQTKIWTCRYHLLIQTWNYTWRYTCCSFCSPSIKWNRAIYKGLWKTYENRGSGADFFQTKFVLNLKVWLEKYLCRTIFLVIR